jgi:hypothetical protein
MESLPNLMERPDLILVFLIGFLFLILIFLALLFAFAPGFAERQFVKEILATPAIQERIRTDTTIDIMGVVNQIMQRIEERAARSRSGIFTKITHDITWDMAGIIGLVVTLALMAMVVTQKFEAIPREVFAGWTMILGYYFGKTARR